MSDRKREFLCLYLADGRNVIRKADGSDVEIPEVAAAHIYELEIEIAVLREQGSREPDGWICLGDYQGATDPAHYMFGATLWKTGGRKDHVPVYFGSPPPKALEGTAPESQEGNDV